MPNCKARGNAQTNAMSQMITMVFMARLSGDMVCALSGWHIARYLEKRIEFG